MTFNAFTKDTNGDYIKIENTVFPFSSSALLDERLNEAILHICTNRVIAYEPTTEIKVVADDGTNTKDYYYIVARDISQELPNGSGNYKHELHLIERTKLLEGIYCQSLCFTNPRGHGFTKLDIQDFSVDNVFSSGDGHITNSQIETYKSAVPLIDIISVNNAPSSLKIPITTPIIFLDFNTIGNNIARYYAENGELSGSANLTYSGVLNSLTVKTNAQETTYDAPQSNLELNIYNPTSFIFDFSCTYSRTVIGETITQSHRFLVNITASVVENQYPLKPWTITECVNRCLDLCEPIFEGENPRFTFPQAQADKYANILAPEFTMTQCTLREQLKVIGGFIHAEPRLTENNEIVFDEYGIGTEASIANKPYIYKAFKHDINEYCTHIETSASNLVNSLNYGKGTVTEPNINNVRTLRTDNVNVMLSESNAFANTDNKIYDIPNQEGGVLVTLFDADGSIYEDDNEFKFENIDITPYIFESHEYNNLSSYDSKYPYSKSFAPYYTRGEKGIRGLFFKNENAVDQYFSEYAIVNIINAVTGKDVKDYVTDQFPRIAFKITYTPIYDTKFSHNKQTITLGETPFMRVYNQSENLIESKYYGEHIKGVAQRLGNLEQTRTYLLYNLNDIPEIAQTIDGYFIADVKIEVLSAHIKCTVELTKDFNRISQYVGISSNKRVFEVSEANAYARDILLKNYVVISDKAETVNANRTIFNSIAPIAQIFEPNPDPNDSDIEVTETPINAVNAKCYSKNGNTPFGEVLLPVIATAFGNTMVFSWDYKDNYSAGESVSQYTNTNGSVKQVWQTDVPYGDYYGRAYWYDFNLLTSPANNGYAQANTISTINEPNEQPTEIIYGSWNRYKLRKDSRERLSVNCELEFVTTRDDIIIGSALASSCPLVSGKTYTTAPQVVFYAEDINKFGALPINTAIPETAINVSVVGNTLTVSFPIPKPSEQNPNLDFKSWAIRLPDRFESAKYENEDGIVETVTYNRGGEFLIGRNKSLTEYGEQPDETITFQIARTIYS